MNAIQRLCQTDGCPMIDPDTPVDSKRVITLWWEATDAIVVSFDARVVERIADCIVAKVEQGVVEEGIPYREPRGRLGCAVLNRTPWASGVYSCASGAAEL